MHKTIMTQTTPSVDDLIKSCKEAMKSIRRILCFFALAFAFSLPALSADKAAPARKRAPAALEARPPAPLLPQPGDVQYADQLGVDV